MNPFCSGPLEQQEALPSENNLPETPTGALHLYGTSSIERPNNEESSQCLSLPEKEKELESCLPDVDHGNTTDGESESLSSNESDSKAKDSHSNLPPSTPDNFLADVPDLTGRSCVQTTLLEQT